MHHLLLEFITGGGMVDQHLPEHLAHEGHMISATLINELQAIGHFKISICRDYRLPLDIANINQILIQHSMIKELKIDQVAADFVWLIAPEHNNCLCSLIDWLQAYQVELLACDPASVKLTSSKYLSYQHLKKKNIESVLTKRLNMEIPPSQFGWIIKPDDGVGSSACQLITNFEDLQHAQHIYRDKNFVVQPYLPGEHLSISLIVDGNECCLLGCNRQLIEINRHAVKFNGIIVNGCLELRNILMDMAQSVVIAINGLSGYVGIDLVYYHGKLYVVDINPRLTTAYVGLSRSLGMNIAELIVNTYQNKVCKQVNLNQAIPVKVLV